MELIQNLNLKNKVFSDLHSSILGTDYLNISIMIIYDMHLYIECNK